MLKVVCVLKMGGWCSEAYIKNLRESIKRHLHMDHEFVCLTDLHHIDEPAGCRPLTQGWKGWWSKLEAFQFTDGPTLFLDLDTIILGDITDIVDLVKKPNDDLLYMLSPLTTHDTFGSGVMLWNGDLSWIMSEFRPDVDIAKHDWDQRYIVDKCHDFGIKIKGIQPEFKGLYSYKLHCKPHRPDDARLVVFHGRPRPHETLWVRWVKDAWLGGGM